MPTDLNAALQVTITDALQNKLICCDMQADAEDYAQLVVDALVAAPNLAVVELPKPLTDHSGDAYWPFESMGLIVHQKVVVRDRRAFLSNAGMIRSPETMRAFAAALLAAADRAESV